MPYTNKEARKSFSVKKTRAISQLFLSHSVASVEVDAWQVVLTRLTTGEVVPMGCYETEYLARKVAKRLASDARLAAWEE